MATRDYALLPGRHAYGIMMDTYLLNSLVPRRSSSLSPWPRWWVRREEERLGTRLPLEIKSEKIRAKAKKATTQYNKHRKEPIDVGERRSLWTT